MTTPAPATCTCGHERWHHHWVKGGNRWACQGTCSCPAFSPAAPVDCDCGHDGSHHRFNTRDRKCGNGLTCDQGCSVPVVAHAGTTLTDEAQEEAGWVAYAQSRAGRIKTIEYAAFRAGFAARGPATEALTAAKADGWDEACRAMAWAFENGPADRAEDYVASHNPYRGLAHKGDRP